jgi:Cu-Zn family superoxide dismutase
VLTPIRVLGTLAILGVLSNVSAAETGRAVIAGTEAGSKLAGEVKLEETDAGLQIEVALSGAPPGEHGFHVHEFGSCDAGGKAAGGHYNPDGVKHGSLEKDGPTGAHAGDLGNLRVQPGGTASLTLVIEPLTLSGARYPVAGRAVILHAEPDDFGQPTGNAGARIACGTIVIAPR